MRTTLVLATFLGVGAGAVGVGAVPQVMKGSDTLFDITTDVVNTCATAVLDINYIGTGSGAGETEISKTAAPAQHVAPMSRFFNKATPGPCAPSESGTTPATAEGINFALDGLSIVASQSTGASATCNGAAIDCSRTTDPNTGLAFSRTITGVAKIVPGPNGALETVRKSGSDDQYLRAGVAVTTGSNIGAEAILAGPDGIFQSTLAGDDLQVAATTYTFSDWRDVLRVVYAGMNHNVTAGGAYVNLKDCGSPERFAIADNYSNLFELGCTTGNCTRLDHAFRRDDVSGTTDTFITLLSLRATANITDPAYYSSFCNGFAQAGPGLGDAPCDLRTDTVVTPGTNGTYDWDYQDNDPIRRTCTDDEEVCSRMGTLGLVQVILPTDFLAVAAAFPTAPSVPGFPQAPAPKVYQAGKKPVAQGRCPNGDISAAFQCSSPTNAAGTFGSMKDKTASGIGLSGTNKVCGFNATQADGRVYNLYLRNNDAVGALIKDTRATPAKREIVGASYRLHSVVGGVPVAGGPAPVAQCQERDATSQIGCLVDADHCSIGYAGRGATTAVAAGLINSLKVDQLDPTDACVRNLLGSTPPNPGTPPMPIPGDAYPISRRLWLNTMVGFESPKVNANELAMAQCFSNRTFIDTIVGNHDFVKLGTDPICVDYNEQNTGTNGCALAAPATDACANNGTIPAPLASVVNGAAIPGSTGVSLP